jgi:hypothetical protein
MRSPVLFLIFNRPEPTQRVFQAIRAARPPRLYVAADGPRADRAGEAERCEAARRVVQDIDWPCRVETLFRSHNLGCKQAVSHAVDWFFEHEEEGIILEDDCLPDPTFFPFCEELLAHYRDEQSVALICGANFQFGRTHGDASYYFSRYVHIWGWASWRRAWRLYDRDIKCWPQFRSNGALERILGSRSREISYWRRIFDSVHAGKIDTWDYQVNLMLWANAMVSVLPQRNLVSNIGFGAEATHTRDASRCANLPLRSMEFPLRHPPVVQTCASADDYTGRELFFRGLPSRVMARLRLLFQRRATDGSSTLARF